MKTDSDKMKLMRNIFFCCIALLAALSCGKEEPASGHADKIRFAPYIPGTKGFIENINASGNTMIVYDWMSKDNENGGDWFMNGVSIACDDNGNWNYSGDFEGQEFFWMNRSNHQFFGWLTKDASISNDKNTPKSFFGNDFRFSDWTLTIPETQMTLNTPQFDFMYSNITRRYYSKDGENNTPAGSGGGDASPINLEMKHLFTAISFGAVNGSTFCVTIEEFKVENILNKRSANISFKNGTISYIDGTENQYLNMETSNPCTIQPDNEEYNVFNPGNGKNYIMLWPLESSYIHSNADFSIDEGEIVGIDDYPEDYRMYIKYSFDDGTGETFEKRMNFPDMDLEAGKRYHFNITFADKIVELKTSVMPWIYDTQTIDYANSAVTVPGGGILSWNDEKSTLMESGGEKLVVIKNGQPAEADFTIDTPLGGVWLISLSGDIDAFRVTPDSGEIDARTAHIRVVPLIDDPKREYKVKLKFAVRRPDGRIISADERVQPAATKRSIILSPM